MTAESKGKRLVVGAPSAKRTRREGQQRRRKKFSPRALSPDGQRKMGLEENGL